MGYVTLSDSLSSEQQQTVVTYMILFCWSDFSYVAVNWTVLQNKKVINKLAVDKKSSVHHFTIMCDMSSAITGVF